MPLEQGKVYSERFYYEGQDIILNYRKQKRFDKINEILDSIDITRVSEMNAGWVYTRKIVNYMNLNDIESAKKWLLLDRKREVLAGKRFWKEEMLLFDFYRNYITEKNELEEAVDYFKECISIYGKYADMSMFESAYESMFYIYMDLGRLKEAKKAAMDMGKYTKSDYIRQEKDRLLSRVYLEMKDFEKSYKHAVLYEKTGYDYFDRKVECLYSMGEYSKVTKMFLERDKEEEYDKDNLYLALHSRFFEKKELDMEFVQEIYDTVSALMEENEEARMGYNYGTMAEMCMHLGRDEEFAKYLKLVNEWDWDETGQKRTLTRLEIWPYILNGELRKAYDCLIALDEKYINADLELGVIKYHLSRLEEKGIL